MDEMHTRTRQNEETRNERRAQYGIYEDNEDYIGINGSYHIWGVTNSPPLQKDLVPRPRTERRRDTRNEGDLLVPT